MIRPLRLAVPDVERPPEVRLLDARGAGLDPAGLRTWARAVTDAAGSPHTSRSYRHPFAVVAWHEDRLGVDVERYGTFGSEFVRSISTPAEVDHQPASLDPDRYGASLWCAKEALAKGLGDALAYDPRRLDAPLRWPAGRSGPWRAAELDALPGHVLWVCWRVEDAAVSPGRRPGRSGARLRRGQ